MNQYTGKIEDGKRGYFIVITDTWKSISARLTQKSVKQYEQSTGLSRQELADRLANQTVGVYEGYYGNTVSIVTEDSKTLADHRASREARYAAHLERERQKELEAEAEDARRDGEVCHCGNPKQSGYDECYDCHIETMTAVNKRSKYPVKF